ncbi:unnamed protein product [Lactuca saligna]|uniref:Transposase n=1 Tax=Lactuca saligna TaxID=75948 RepID=A0AA35VA58_LACSI|nr:unnamed protein product [Lactuca saligna]
MVPITYESWLEVSEEVREGLWQYVLICFQTNPFFMFQEKFVVDPKSQKQTPQSIRKKWRKFKHYLYAKFIKNRSKDPKINLFKPPKDYLFIKKEDWKVFVSHRVIKKWEEKSTKAKNTPAHHKYNHRLSRKGYVGLINDIMHETGKTEEEIDRTLHKLPSRGVIVDVEKKPRDESLDNSCLLAVEFAANVVAKGTIMN